MLSISMLWHRQAIFKSKVDKLSSAAECRIWTRVFGTESPADWMPTDKPTELSRIKLLNLNSIAHPYHQRAFSPLDPTAIWLSHLALAIYMFVVVNVDALAQANDFQIERRQVVFLCWMQDLNQGLWNRSIHTYTYIYTFTYTYTYTWWHQKETFPRYWPFVQGIHRSSVNSPHKGQWHGALMRSEQTVE